MSHETQKWMEAAVKELRAAIPDGERLLGPLAVEIIARHAPVSERNQGLEEAANVADKAAAARREGIDSLSFGRRDIKQLLACATQADLIAIDIRALQSRPPCTCTCTPCTDGNHVCCNFRCDAKNRTGENIERVAAESRPACAEPSDHTCDNCNQHPSTITTDDDVELCGECFVACADDMAQHDEDCPCSGDDVEHAPECANCTCNLKERVAQMKHEVAAKEGE